MVETVDQVLFSCRVDLPHSRNPQTYLFYLLRTAVFLPLKDSIRFLDLIRDDGLIYFCLSHVPAEWALEVL